MYFIDYLPWYVYISIAVFSIIVIVKYILFNNKYSVQDRLGAFLIILGGVAIIIDKIEKTKFHIKYYSFIQYFIPLVFIGFFVFAGGIIKRTEDPERKRKLIIYYWFLFIICGFSGIFILYLFLTGNW